MAGLVWLVGLVRYDVTSMLVVLTLSVINALLFVQTSMRPVTVSEPAGAELTNAQGSSPAIRTCVDGAGAPCESQEVAVQSFALSALPLLENFTQVRNCAFSHPAAASTLGRY